MTAKQRIIQLKLEDVKWKEIVEIMNNEYPRDGSWDVDRCRPYWRKSEEKKALEVKNNEIGEVKHKEKRTVKITPQGKEYIFDGVIGLDSDKLNDEDYILKMHKYNPKLFEIIESSSSIWDQNSNENGLIQLYASKLRVRPITKIREDDMLEHFIEQTKNYSPVSPRVIKQSNENMLLLNVTDIHNGQLSWHMESGDNYDSKIARERFEYVVNDAIAKSPYKNYESIYTILGNDLFNSDNMEGSTTKGTKQTNDVRPQKMFNKSVNMRVWEIDILRKAFPNSPIRELLVTGNHDRLASYYAAEYLHAFFRNDPTVTIDICPKQHKGFAYGDTALLFTHGERELKNLDWVYKEFRELIGKTKVTEIHAGHQHRLRVEEKNGIITRVNPSIAALDNWSYGMGYGSVSQAITRIYSKKALEYEIYSRV